MWVFGVWNFACFCLIVCCMCLGLTWEGALRNLIIIIIIVIIIIVHTWLCDDVGCVPSQLIRTVHQACLAVWWCRVWYITVHQVRLAVWWCRVCSITVHQVHLAMWAVCGFVVFLFFFLGGGCVSFYEVWLQLTQSLFIQFRYSFQHITDSFPIRLQNELILKSQTFLINNNGQLFIDVHL